MAPDATTQKPFASFDTVIFDLDDCLYHSHEMPTQCRLNIEAYMRDKLKIPAEEVPVLCAQAYSEHGTTLAGLVHLGHEVDYDDWHLDVHGKLPYDEELSDDPELRAVLQSIPQPKWIFTNADEVRHVPR